MPKNILVGVLDWGLGHATRSIPLIRYMLQTQCQIHVASSGAQKKILMEAFPGLNFLEPPAYAIKYPPGGKNLQFSILKQIPRLMRVIEEEQKWVSGIVSEYGINRIISDNRYGFHSPDIPSVMITHQLSPRSGLGPLLNWMARRAHYHFLKPFSEIWVPDLEEIGGLAGRLSHPPALPANTYYIGPLSRFALQNPGFGDRGFGDRDFAGPGFGEQGFGGEGRIVVMVSGPEPSRTEFENMIRPQLETADLPYTLIRGLPGSRRSENENELNHADDIQLVNLLSTARLVICRSGYSSVMDLVRLRKKALLVPTPGQTEQEYLANHLQEQNMFPFMKQSEFDLGKALVISENFDYRSPAADFEQFKESLERFINYSEPYV